MKARQDLDLIEPVFKRLLFKFMHRQFAALALTQITRA
jgi:hypothetical protein